MLSNIYREALLAFTFPYSYLTLCLFIVTSHKRHGVKNHLQFDARSAACSDREQREHHTSVLLCMGARVRVCSGINLIAANYWFTPFDTSEKLLMKHSEIGHYTHPELCLTKLP